MIRVIHYLPSINCTSGIANLIMNYYRNIDRKNIQFYFIYFSKLTENNFKNEIEKLGGTCTYIIPPNKFKKFSFDFNDYIKTFYQNYEDDIIIFHNHQLAFTVFQYSILKKNNIKHIIVHNHMTKFSDNILKSFRNMLLFLPVTFLPVEYFSCSEDACKLLMRYNFVRRKNIFIMSNAIDCDKFKFDSKIREKYRKMFNLESKIVLGNVGHFEPVKNHKFIINLFYNKFNDDKHALILVGNGSLKNKIINLINKKKLNNKIIVLETRNDIKNILFCIDCFIFPSKFEGMGIAALEAQAAGVPVVISKNVPSEVMICNCEKITNYNMNNWQKNIDLLLNTDIDRILSNNSVGQSIFNIFNAVNIISNKYKQIGDENLEGNVKK